MELKRCRYCGEKYLRGRKYFCCNDCFFKGERAVRGRRGRAKIKPKTERRPRISSAHKKVGEIWEAPTNGVTKWFPQTMYKYIMCKDRKPRSVHRETVAKVLGRKLKKGEIVHHINGNTLDNKNFNLLVCSAGYHLYLHHAMSRKYAASIAGSSVRMS